MKKQAALDRVLLLTKALFLFVIGLIGFAACIATLSHALSTHEIAFSAKNHAPFMILLADSPGSFMALVIVFLFWTIVFGLLMQWSIKDLLSGATRLQR